MDSMLANMLAAHSAEDLGSGGGPVRVKRLRAL
jgi:hypothetical protein